MRPQVRVSEFVAIGENVKSFGENLVGVSDGEKLSLIRICMDQDESNKPYVTEHELKFVNEL